MQLVLEIQRLTNFAVHDNAIRLHTHQAQFLESTKTHWIRNNSLNQSYLTRPLYDILRDMKLSQWLATKSDQPLFHAISPMATKDGYLVRYLPQYGAQACEAIAKLPHQHTRRPTVLKGLTTAMPLQSNPNYTGATTAPSPQEALDKLFATRFTKHCYLSLLPTPHLYTTGVHQATHRRAPGPSSYQLYQWLLALWQLFQNTAWDRWRYRNGITKSKGIQPFHFWQG